MLLHNLYYLNKCCPDPLLFQSKLYDNAKPPFKAAYHVRAGNNVGASYTIGPVTVQNGGNVTYLAGTDISLEDGFSVDLEVPLMPTLKNVVTTPFQMVL